MKNLVLVFLGSLILMFLVTCGNDSNPDVTLVSCPAGFTAKGDRLFGMDILNMAETGAFADNIAKGKVAGMEFIGVHLAWSQIEANGGSGTTSGIFSDPYDGAIKAFIDVVQANNLKFTLMIKPIDIPGKTVPLDLYSYRFDNADFQTRFKALLDYVLNIKGTDGTTTIQNYLTSLQIGNEIDGYNTSSEHTDFWSHYGNFLYNMMLYVHTINTNIKVGYTATFHGATSLAKKDIFRALADAVDVIGITYYPIDSDFSVQAPSIVTTDLQTLVDTFRDKGKPIFLQEVGYQTTAESLSSESKQAEFFCAFFQAWDTQKDYIKLAEIVRLQDISNTAAADMAAPYGISSDDFKEYLRTLGLRTYPGVGQDKEAYAIIKGETAKRGW